MSTVYGYCPQCGGLGMSRERRKDGNDRCENGHNYPSSTAVANPLLPVAELRALGVSLHKSAAMGRDAERAAVVSALERWAEDGGDPWMSFCADRIKSGEHRREEEK